MIEKKTEKSKEFSRRAFIIAGIHAGIFTGLAARLGYLQIIQKDKYKTLSDKNRISMRLIPPVRGEITDRFGVPLAVNNQNFRVFLTPEQADDVKDTIKSLKRYIPISEIEEEEIHIRIKKQRSFTPVMVKEDISWDQMAKIEVALPYLAGISINEGKLRNYPLRSSTAHITGYVGLISEAEITKDPITSLPGFRIGKTGVEKSFDNILRGNTGRIQSEINASGREIRELKSNDSQNGRRLSLTIDAELQIFCQNRLAQERSAAAVIMDAHNGDIYSIGSNPSFDPNLFTKKISNEQWQELISHPDKPLNNKAISGQYSPGSTFKMITALAALENGIVDRNYTVHCPGYSEFGRDRFYCWKQSGHGWVNLVSALEQSCDCFFYDIARKTGIKKIGDMAKRFGFGDKIGIDLQGEASGLMPTKAWKMGKLGRKWQIGDTVVAGIGQGYIQSTTLQLAVMTSRLINGGVAINPRILKSIDGIDTKIKREHVLNIDKKNLEMVIRGMEAVMTGKKGTARKAQLEDKEMHMGGKTGTVQVKRITKAQRAAGIKNEDLDWKSRHHALFVGFAPLKKPRYVCSVIVEHGVSGSGSAAPLARDLLQETQIRNPADPNSSIVTK